ncbi:PQQ-binding-like beta-propeller repeat protein [Nocardia rhizosphaerihabitans]|uniref:outer membrane protein assembly factor BamB family protein n=1 Tax=Nocardia rhizosphaerihabitans TaxID=1691570 RepID=UPI003670AF94
MAAAAILGVVVLIGGVTLGIYSLFLAAGNPVTPSRDVVDDIAVELGVFATAIGTVVLLTLVSALRWSRRLQAAGFGNLPTVAMHVAVVVEFFIIINLDIRSTVEKTFENYSAFPQLPTAVAAWVLVVVGTVLVLGASFSRPTRGALSNRTGAIMAVIGVVACVVATGVAVRAGDDTRYIDHRTAAAEAAPSVPNRMGQEKFRLHLPASATVVAGGHGFLVGTKIGITAYDGVTGTPRWHYLRPDATNNGVSLDVDSLVSIESANVVVAYWYRQGWTAFDALTGDKLWSDSDFSRGKETGLSPIRALDKHTMLARGENGAFIRYDARTGRQLWSAPAEPSSCRPARSKIAVTSAAVYQVMKCNTGGTASTTIRALDALTGATIAERDLPNPDPDRTLEVSVIDDVVSIDWNYRTEPLRHLHFTSPDQLRTAEVTEPVRVIAADPTSVLTSSTQERETTLSDVEDPTRSRSVPVAMGALCTPYRVGLLLADELVSTDHGLQTWRRDDLVENTPDQGFQSCALTTLLLAPGTILIFCRTTIETQQIIGSAPR